MRIRSKLVSVNLVVSLFVILVGVISLQAASKTEKNFSTLADTTLPILQVLEEIRLCGVRLVSSSNELAFIKRYAGKHTDEEMGGLSDDLADEE